MIRHRICFVLIACWLFSGCLVGTSESFEPVTDRDSGAPLEWPDARIDAGRPVVDAGIPVADASPDGDAEDAEQLDAQPDVDAPTPPPNLTAHFTNPVDGESPDLTLEDVLLDLIAQTPAGATIRGSYFTWSRTRMARAFGDALDRGVDVRLVIGNGSRHEDGTDWAAVKILKERLGDRLTICEAGKPDGACIGTGINHNKFVVFSELEDGSRDVVFQSSANLTRPQLVEYNNAVTIRNDATLYQAYLDYWADLQADATNLDYYRSTKGELGTKVYFFPRSSGDTIVAILGNVRCEVGARVRVTMAYFTNARIEIARALRQMAIDGCDIGVATRTGELLGDEVVAELTHPEVDLAVLPGAELPTIHSKYMFVDGAYGTNATQQRLVWTGSHNFTGTALRINDETLLKISDDAVFEAYDADWTRIRSRVP